MNIGDLRHILSKYPDGYQVVMSRDSEGNGKSPLFEAAEMMYLPDTTYSGDTYPTPEEIADSNGYYGDDDRAPEGAYRVICLWPVN